MFPVPFLFLQAYEAQEQYYMNKNFCIFSVLSANIWTIAKIRCSGGIFKDHNINIFYYFSSN